MFRLKKKILHERETEREKSEHRYRGIVCAKKLKELLVADEAGVTGDL